MKGEHKLKAGKSKTGMIMALVASRAQKAKNAETVPVKKGFKR
jgi:hypothetical protein